MRLADRVKSARLVRPETGHPATSSRGERRRGTGRSASPFRVLMGARADQGDDQQERDGNQEKEDATRNDAGNLKGRRRGQAGQRRGPVVVHQSECVDLRPTGADIPVRTAGDSSARMSSPSTALSQTSRCRSPLVLALRQKSQAGPPRRRETLTITSGRAENVSEMTGGANCAPPV